MSTHPTGRSPGWGTVILDTLVAWLMPSVLGKVLRVAVPEGAALVGALLAVQLLAFFLIGKARGRDGLARHLARVGVLMAGASLLLGGFNWVEWALGLPALAGCAALGGWAGSRRE
jgi:hypothetical protein